MSHPWRVTVSLCGLLGACVEPPPPILMSGIVYDPEEYFLGNVQRVPNVQVTIVEDELYGDISDSNGEFEIADLPANFNWHTGAIDDNGGHLRTLDGLGTELTTDDIENYHVPILRRGGLMLQFAKWLGVTEEDLDSLGLIVIAVLDDRPPLGHSLGENISVAPSKDGCTFGENTAFVTHDGESFSLVRYLDGALPPDEFSGMMLVQAPQGCIVSASLRDNTGEFTFLSHSMQIDDEYVIFQLYVPE